MKALFFIGIFLSLLLAGILSKGENPYNADMVVAADGSGNFTKIQQAIDAAPSNSSRRTIIYIKRGLYNSEKLIIPAEKKNITFIGESRSETIISYHIYDCSGGKCPAEDAALWTGDNIRTSATLTIQGEGFRAENLTIQNTAGPVGQAQAITVRSDKCVFVNCDFLGYQDTMYFWNSGIRSYFQNCLIAGRTDYIYGSGIVFFKGCEIRSWGGGWITAPSTPQSQAYGFVFYECNITYALNSPRSGDDGALVRFGRPWNDYPKVAWLYCEMSDKIHPEGWGDTWNMTYAATSTDLHLYEYKNTGAGAGMSGRANWAGLRALSDEEALNYTPQKVLAGTDGWDPTAEPPLVKQYSWVGNSATNGWLIAENWNPAGVPANGESATISGAKTANADGSIFAADLILKDSAKLEITANSSASFISASGAEFLAPAEVSLSGKIATKDTNIFSIAGKLVLDATLSGIHKIIKNGPGQLTLSADNSGFSGAIGVNSGTLEASVSNALGKGDLEIKNGATLIIGNSNAFYPKSKLNTVAGASLVLNTDLIANQFYIDGAIQATGEYSASTNPGLISGSGKVIVGRPEEFSFIGGANGNWDDPSHFSPALLPLAGETVICEKEMETTSTVFPANIFFRNGGSLRLRGNHKCTGTIHAETGTIFRYNTGGTGMSIDAPVSVDGNSEMILESGNTSGSTMTLAGPISGSAKVTAYNNGKGTVNTGTLLLTGDNSGFSGTWDLTKYSQKYPSVQGYITTIEGQSADAFGSGKIEIGLANKVIFSHEKAAGDNLNLKLANTAKAVLNANVSVKNYLLNGTQVVAGTYSATTNPEYYEGTGSITVGATGINNTKKTGLIKTQNETIHIFGNRSAVSAYTISGSKILSVQNARTVSLENFPHGIYVIQYEIDGQKGVLKFSK